MTSLSGSLTNLLTPRRKSQVGTPRDSASDAEEAARKYLKQLSAPIATMIRSALDQSPLLTKLNLRGVSEFSFLTKEDKDHLIKVISLNSNLTEIDMAGCALVGPVDSLKRLLFLSKSIQVLDVCCLA